MKKGHYKKNKMSWTVKTLQRRNFELKYEKKVNCEKKKLS